MSNGPRRTSNFLPGGLAAMAAQRASGRFADPRQTINMPMDFSRPVVLGADILGGKSTGYATAMPTAAETARQSALARQRRQSDIMKAFGLGAPSKLPQADVAAPTSAGIADTVSSYLPETGTPEMAGLGAAGRTMMQLGGWQDKPYTLGQILGAGAEKGLEAMKARQDAMTAAAEKKAAAERQAKLDEIKFEELRIKQEQEKRAAAKEDAPITKSVDGTLLVLNKETGKFEVAYSKEKGAQPLSPEGKLAVDMGYKIGTPEYAKFVSDRLAAKGKTSELTALQKEAAQIYPNDKKKQAEWVKERRERPRGITQRAGVVLDKNGARVGRAVFNQSPAEGESPVQVIDPKTNKPRNLAEGETSVEQSLMNDLVIPQEKYMALEKDILQGKQSIRKLNKYIDNIKAGKEGLGRTADQFITLGKTFFSSLLPEEYRKLSPSQLATAIAEGQLQGLIGASRLEVVGGGVMTEQDALRIIQYLGGDVNAFQNKQRVEEAIKYVLTEKAETYNLNARNFNEQTAYRGGTRSPVELIDVGQFSSSMTTATPVVDPNELNAALGQYGTN